MKLTTNHGYLDTTTSIDNTDIENIDTEILRSVCENIVKKCSVEVLKTIITEYIEYDGERTDNHHCELCGDDNYEMEVEV